MNKDTDSDSTVQRSMEPVILERFNKKNRLALEPKERAFKYEGIDIKISLDGLQDNNGVCCIAEIYARQGALKPGNTNKITRDILKMLLFEKLSGKKCEKYLILADKGLKEKFDGNKSWLRTACAAFDIKINVVELAEKDILAIKEAQNRQDLTA